MEKLHFESIKATTKSPTHQDKGRLLLTELRKAEEGFVHENERMLNFVFFLYRFHGQEVKVNSCTDRRFNHDAVLPLLGLEKKEKYFQMI